MEKYAWIAKIKDGMKDEYVRRHDEIWSELVALLKNFTVEIKGKRPVAEAIITSGGVKVSQINPKTMESKIVPGLFFAGEIIDCDAYTGGFNLQIAWATAYAAAQGTEGRIKTIIDK